MRPTSSASSSRLPLVFALSLAWLACGLFRGAGGGYELEGFVYDEGIALVGGLRLLQGELPYRDFYDIYTPGQYYLSATLLLLFGKSVLADRVGSLVVRAAIATLAFALGRRLAGERWAALGAFLSLAWLGHYSYYGIASFPALALGLAGVAAAGWPSSRGARLLVPGACAGAAFLFRMDFGLYAAAAQALSLAVAEHSQGRARALVDAGRRYALFAAGFLAVVALPAAYYATEIGAAELYRTIFVWPVELTREYRALAYPWPSTDAAAQLSPGHRLPFLLTPLIHVVAAALALGRRHPGSDPGARRMLHLALLGGLLFLQAASRSDPIHLAPSWLCALILLPALLAGLRSGLTRGALAVALAIVLLAAPLLGLARTALPSLATALTVQADVPRSGPIRLAQDQAAALRFVRGRTEPTDAVFVGNTRHDVTVWNDITFYFLADRPIPTRYHKFDPGVTTREDVQREIIEELRRRAVHWVVLYGGSEQRVEPNRSAVPGSTVLDTFLRDRYRPVADFGSYRILTGDPG